MIRKLISITVVLLAGAVCWAGLTFPVTGEEGDIFIIPTISADDSGILLEINFTELDLSSFVFPVPSTDVLFFDVDNWAILTPINPLLDFPWPDSGCIYGVIITTPDFDPIVIEDFYIFTDPETGQDYLYLVPEPATMLLVGVGGLLLRRRK